MTVHVYTPLLPLSDRYVALTLLDICPLGTGQARGGFRSPHSTRSQRVVTRVWGRMRQLGTQGECFGQIISFPVTRVNLGQ